MLACNQTIFYKHHIHMLVQTMFARENQKRSIHFEHARFRLQQMKQETRVEIAIARSNSSDDPQSKYKIQKPTSRVRSRTIAATPARRMNSILDGAAAVSSAMKPDTNNHELCASAL